MKVQLMKFQNNTPLRDAFGLSLKILGSKYKNLIAISPDLKQATKLSYFFSKFPERSIETGISEANAVGIAAGLAMSGHIPILSSFSSFITGKNIEIRSSIALNKCKVIIVGTHGGIIGPDGASQSGQQDIAVMRSIPYFDVFQPSTPIEVYKILHHCIKSKNPSYIRISREDSCEVYREKHTFKLGNIDLVRKFKKYNKLSIITSGVMLKHIINVDEDILNECNVYNLSTVKPINISSLKKIINNSKKILVVEDHSFHGGLFSSLAESVTKNNLASRNTLFYSLSLGDAFVQSGSLRDLYSKYKLDNKSIKRKIMDIIKLK